MASKPPPRWQKTKVVHFTSLASENAAAPPLPPRDPTSTGPRPTRLSTEPTKPKNEPMFSDMDMMGFPGVAPYLRANEFTITTEGFIPLCEKEYDTIASNQPYFAKVVAKSAWVYYCTISLYARFISIRQEEGDSTYNEDSFANQILSGNHVLPGPIDTYVSGFGHIVDTASLRYRLAIPAWPNQHGHFGRISVDTHWMYMSMPCPEVCVQRIQADLRVTATPGNRDWDLSGNIRPADVGAGLPTRNLLGWARAATLTNDQVAFLESADIMEEQFPTKFEQFKYNSNLFEKISMALTKTEEKIKVVPTVKKSVQGSLAQVCWSNVEILPGVVSPNVHYTESSNNQIVTSEEIDARQVLAALILSYRVRKDSVVNTRPYCIYRFNNYTVVPDTWHTTRNRVFEYGRSERWNMLEYTAPFTDKSEYRLAWLKRHIKFVQ